MAQRRRGSVCGREEREERERERKLTLEENFFRESLKVFFKISSLFPYEMFSRPKLFVPNERISLPKICRTSCRTLIYVRKSFKNKIRIEIRIKIHFNYCFTV